MVKTFFTINHLEDFMAADFVNPGDTLILKKEQNKYDDESITVYSTNGVKYGYVANSTSTVARGTHSAGYIYREFDKQGQCIIRFRLEDVAIAELISMESTQNEITSELREETENEK